MKTKKPYSNYLVDNIKWLRKEFELTQQAFAFSIGTNKKSIDAWEQKRAEPQLIHLIAIKHIFGYTIDDLVKKNLSRQPKVK